MWLETKTLSTPGHISDGSFYPNKNNRKKTTHSLLVLLIKQWPVPTVEHFCLTVITNCRIQKLIELFLTLCIVKSGVADAGTGDETSNALEMLPG